MLEILLNVCTLFAILNTGTWNLISHRLIFLLCDEVPWNFLRCYLAAVFFIVFDQFIFELSGSGDGSESVEPARISFQTRLSSM